jgi:hypothetical protein
MMPVSRTWGSGRQRVLFALALGVGVAIALIDSSPGWDDTGVTVGLLVVTAALAAALSGRRPWLWALLVGAWTPALEIARGGQPASLAALAFSAVGAAVGYLCARAVSRPGPPASPPGSPSP